MGGHERVVAVGDDDAVFVVDLEQAVARPIRPIEALETPGSWAAESVVVDLLEHRLAGHRRHGRACGVARTTSCPTGSAPRPPRGGRPATPGAMILLIWRVALPAPRISISTSSGETTNGAVAAARDPERGASAMATTTRGSVARGGRPSDDPGRRPGGRVGGPWQGVEGRARGRAGRSPGGPTRTRCVTPPPLMGTMTASWASCATSMLSPSASRTTRNER